MWTSILIVRGILNRSPWNLTTLDCKPSLPQLSTKQAWLLKFCTSTAALAWRSRRIDCLCLTLIITRGKADLQSNFCIDRASLLGRLKLVLICSRGHYDLLYKAEDVAEMSRHAMSNPEIRLVSAPQIPISRNAHFPHDLNLEMLADIPGFSSSMFPMPYTHTSAEPYQSTVEPFSSTPRTIPPATTIFRPYQNQVETFSSTSRTTTPATPNYSPMDTTVKEEHSPKTMIHSPISLHPKELPIQADFKPKTKQQRRYDRRLFKAQGEQIQSDVMKE